MKLWDTLKESMLRFPDREIREGEACITYEEMAVFAELFACKMAGIRCCAILCRSELAAAMALLSCFAGGITAVPLSHRYGEAHERKILETISPEAVITDDNASFQIHLIKKYTYRPPKHPPALIMCTSGTTGTPKGVMLSEKNIQTAVLNVTDYFGIGREDTVLITRPLYHCAVLTGEFLTALRKGCCIRFYSGAFSPQVILQMIDRYRITVFGGTPTMLAMMARFNRKRSAETLRHISISGESMSRDSGKKIAEAFPNAAVYYVYGLTEASPRVSYLPPELFPAYGDYVGIPVRSVTVRIEKNDGTAAKTGEEGTLWIKGENVMMGYYRDSAATGKVLRNGWLCTGDIAVLTEKGLLKIKGRRDGLIIRAGMNIYPQEIEFALQSDPRVKEVMAYGIRDADEGMRIGLKAAGDFTSADEVREICAARLPAYQMPSVIEIIKELEKNASGKIKRTYAPVSRQSERGKDI